SGSGNGTLNPYAAAPWVIGVGATDETGRLAGFSSRGSFGDALQHPSLVAPGANVASLRSVATSAGTTGLASADLQRLTPAELPYYTTASGTSFSAPQVAGAVALMLEANPSLTPAKVKDILARTATPLPKYFYHEAGAGMLNTYAAVLESAFPERRMGAFRSVVSRNSVRFITSTTQTFAQMVFPNSAAATNIFIPQNTVQASVNVSWGLGVNDFGLRLYGANNGLIGESNTLNLPGLTGRREKIVLRNPASQTVTSSVRHTGYAGIAQNVFGAVEVTRVEYPALLDLNGLSPVLLADAEQSLLANLMLPEGKRFNPLFAVSRAELADTIVRSGLVPQYRAGNPMFIDVRDSYTRNSVESVQSNPTGRLFVDVANGDRFYPNNSASRLIAAIAFVTAANLDAQAATTTLSVDVADALQIPPAFRGYVAVALQNGYLVLDGNRFNPNRSVTRIELAHSINTLVR
ncbi:MAG: S8 family serine peptidase, partial [Pyrinomonadaceae bacterium]